MEHPMSKEMDYDKPNLFGGGARGFEKEFGA